MATLLAGSLLLRCSLASSLYVKTNTYCVTCTSDTYATKEQEAGQKRAHLAARLCSRLWSRPGVASSLQVHDCQADYKCDLVKAL
jgi:hypothetical protein